jgi:hypothetical protein
MRVSKKAKGVLKAVTKSLGVPMNAKPSLASKVGTLQRVVRQIKSTTSEVNYGTGGNQPIGNVAGNNVYIFPISQYSTWTRIFGTDADDESNHSALWKKTEMDMKLFTNGERNQIDYSMFIVSLTKLGMEELFTQASGGLAGPLGITGLVNGTHYYGNISGQVYLNKRYFNILRKKRLTTGSPGSLATDTPDLAPRFQTVINHNAGKGHTLRNAKGDWKAIPSPQLASQNLYILIFSNDSTADAGVFLQWTGLHTLQIA